MVIKAFKKLNAFFFLPFYLHQRCLFSFYSLDVVTRPISDSIHPPAALWQALWHLLFAPEYETDNQVP